MRKETGLAMALAWTLVMATAHGAADDLAFHVKDRDFRVAAIPNWVYEGLPKAFTRLADTPEGAKMIDEYAKLGVKVLHSGGFPPYYPLKRDDPKSGLTPEMAAAIKATVTRVKGHGMRIILGIYPAAPATLVRQHPEWMIYPVPNFNPREKIKLDLTKPKNFSYCVLGLDTPWGDYLIDCLVEAMREYHFDGVSFDGNYHPVINYAPYAKAMYKKDTGREFPAHADLNDINYRLYLLWADDKLENWYRKLQDRLRQANPEAAVYTWTTNAGRYGHFMTTPRVMSTRMNMAFSCPIQEWWMDEVNMGASIVPAFGAMYVRAVNGNRVGACDPYLMARGNPYCTESFPRHEIVTRSLLALTNGAIAATGIECPEAIGEVRRRAPWFAHAEQIPWAALLVSEQTRQFYGLYEPVTRYMPHPFGVFRVAMEEHLPLTLINDWDITPETLAKFRVLVLANSACLSDEQVRAIRDYVAKGGGLVATCDTSLFDEIGRPRHDFALSDLFGVSHRGRPKAPDTRPALDANFAIVVDENYWAQRVGVAAFRWGGGDITTSDLVDDARLKALVPGGQATFKGPLLKITDPKAPMKRAMIMFPDAGPEAIPAASMGEYGKGRVIYLAAGIDAACYSYYFPYQRVLMARAMNWVARRPADIQVKAPMCVQSTFFTQSHANGQRVIVHLFNGINTTSDHGVPEADVPLREETIPISGITLRFHNLNIKRFHLEPQGINLPATDERTTKTVTLPALEIHALVVGEMQ